MYNQRNYLENHHTDCYQPNVMLGSYKPETRSYPLEDYSPSNNTTDKDILNCHCNFCQMMAGDNCGPNFSSSSMNEYSMPVLQKRKPKSVPYNVSERKPFLRLLKSSDADLELIRKQKAVMNEKRRVQEMNKALERLRTCIPHEVQKDHKMSKLKILQFATDYIKFLTNELQCSNIDCKRNIQITNDYFLQSDL